MGMNVANPIPFKTLSEVVCESSWNGRWQNTNYITKTCFPL